MGLSSDVEAIAVKIPRLVIAGTGSGVGKTTITIGLMRALSRQGRRVAPFKVGPDYIDPSYHTAATGCVSRNLDSWMCALDSLPELFTRAAAGADVAIIEGVMGLFDGHSPTGERGSTAEVAKALGAPVVLVVDAGGMARSAAAMVQGYARFDPDLRVAGVIFNRVGSAGHFQLLKEALAADLPEVTALGWLPGDSSLHAPERHLGLIPASERSHVMPYLDAAADRVAAGVDMAALLSLAGEAPPLPPSAPAIFGGEPQPRRCRIALAQDEAFHFYYQDGLDLLEHLGAELVPFRPTVDQTLPPDCDLIYIGGGFPEVYRERLAANASLMHAIRDAHGTGMPIYAECGGLMYLTREIVGFDGSASPMLGLLPSTARMQRRLVALGYSETTMLQDTLLGPAGTKVRGHVFHYSMLDQPPADPAMACAYRGATRREGFAGPNLLASYVHVHFAANPHAAEQLVARATAYRRVRHEGRARS
jgi:cobyrinic acid a,c-diamide synthase